MVVSERLSTERFSKRLGDPVLSRSVVCVVTLVFATISCKRARASLPGAAMVTIPAATVLMGCDVSRDAHCSPTERPAHRVQVARFRIDRTEVTERQYAACVAAGSCTAPRPAIDPERHPLRPVTGVTWYQARAFCAWSGKRLPTEKEWELAARGTDGRIYPWGDSPPTCERAHTSSCGETPADVGGRPAGASPFGVLDMAGNVDEWVEDRYAAYPGAPGASGPSKQRVVRGGAYDAWHVRSTARSALEPDYRGALVGFRCAASL